MLVVGLAYAPFLALVLASWLVARVRRRVQLALPSPAHIGQLPASLPLHCAGVKCRAPSCVNSKLPPWERVQ